MLSLFMCISLCGCFGGTDDTIDDDMQNTIKETTGNGEEENMYDDYSYDGNDYDAFMEEDE